MKGIAEGTVKVDQTEKQQEAAAEGAILMSWHILMVLKDCEHQLAPQTQQMDIAKGAAALQIFSAIHKIAMYVEDVVADPRLLSRVLVESAALARQVNEQMRQGAAGSVQQPVQKSSIVIMDGR